jgi:hypothetical protein
VNDFACEAPQPGFYICPSDLQVSSPQRHEQHLHIPSSSSINFAFDSSLLPPVTWHDDDTAFYFDSDSISMIGSKADVELVPSTVDDNLLPPIADSVIPEDKGTSASCLPNQSSSRSPPHARKSNAAIPFVCYDCPHRPSFGKRYQYNKHRKRHDRPRKCSIGECRQGFASNRDLKRHMASKHPEATSQGRYYCHHSNCDRAMTGLRGGFPRKDSLKRHLKTHQNREEMGHDT